MRDAFAALTRRLGLLLQGRIAPFPVRPDSHAEIGEEEAASSSATQGRRRFLIVTPAFNAGCFIDEAIASVLRQGIPGYSLHYHVQDGGSTDGTLDRLHAWERRLHDGSYRPSDDIVFSFASERDGGMYDALQRGFDRLAPQDDDLLTWINSDDALAQGSLVTVAGVFDDAAGCEFLSGRVALLNEAGAVIVLAPALPYARGALADGLHDGRTLPFLMQEGTFFSGRVWNTVGGVDPSFRLAGDWDLWRRMARVANHCIVDSVTGYHRRRRGQLSSDMVGYYREVDAAPTLPASEFGALGTVVSFDQASARWIETAYDPTMLMAPALLRDGRPEFSAACRPVAGFAAPEGPYPQYGLPGGIRWIEGHRAEIAMQVPVAGRYRLRLMLRASRDNVVVGLGIGARASQPITLEPPMPLVDQVIETVRWLDAGESRLVIDCDGSATARSVLLIRCEVTSTDEAFARRPVLAPARFGKAGLPPAIVILCADDEPDLLDLSLAGCEEAALAGTAVFVVRDPASMALDRVLRHRQVVVAGCIDGRGPQVNVEPVRQGLHDAGHANVLIVPRGSFVVPRGIAAASALLDETGAGAASGFVDERDSTGRSLHLSSTTGAPPVLYRATSTPTAMLRVGCALAQTVARASDDGDAPVIWVLDGDRPMLGRTPAALLAAGLALLGYDVRHVVTGPQVASNRVPAGARVVASAGLDGAPDGAMTIARDAGRLRLLGADGAAVDLPLAVDTDLLLPCDRNEARRRLGFDPDERIVCIAETTVEARAAARAAALVHGSARILDLGSVGPSDPSDGDILSLGAIADPLLLSFLLGAADAALALEPGGGPLAGAAWACHLPVLDPSGRMLRPGDDLGPGDDLAGATAAPSSLVDREVDARRSRDLVVATRSLIALAEAIDAHCPGLGAVGGSSPLRLRGGAVPVRSYRDAERPGWFDRIDGGGTMIPLDGATPFVAADGEQGMSIDGSGAQIIVCLKRMAVLRLRLLLRGAPGAVWALHAGDGVTTVRLGEDGTATASVVGADNPGPIRVRFERQGDSDVPLLHVVGLSAVARSVPVTPDWAETRFELVPANAWPVAELQVDGDWQRGAGFLPPEPAVPQEGLHVPFRWSQGSRCVLRVRATVGGARVLRIALSAGVMHQRIRPVVAGRAYDWCTPTAGPIGHVEHREWLVDWQVGDVDVTLELSDVLRAPGQELGIILFAVALAPAGV